MIISLQIELGELMEHFQWMDSEEFSKKYNNDPLKKNNISEEIADVFWYLLLLAESLNIDMESAILTKMEQNAKKYPVEKAKGNCKKYTEFRSIDK